MSREIAEAQVANPKAGVSRQRGQVVNPDPARPQGTVQRLWGGFHAGLLDTGFMAFDDPLLDRTMSG